jgi:hypothetical protein
MLPSDLRSAIHQKTRRKKIKDPLTKQRSAQAIK